MESDAEKRLESPDVELAVQRFRASRSEEAFEVLLEQGQFLAITLSKRYGLTPGDGEDIAQDIMSRLWERPAIFKGKSSFTTWFTRCVQKGCFKVLRKKKTVEKNWAGLAIQSSESAVLSDPAQAVIRDEQ